MRAFSLKRPLHRKYWLVRHRFFRTPLRAVASSCILGAAIYEGVPALFDPLVAFISGIKLSLLLSVLGAGVPVFAVFGFLVLVTRIKEARSLSSARGRAGREQTPSPPSPLPLPAPPAGGWQKRRQAMLRQWEPFQRKLDPASTARFTGLQRTVQRLGSLFSPREDDKSPLLLPGEYLLWLYLKLLLARDHLETNARESRAEDLQTQLAALETDLQQPDLTPTTRDSKQETVMLLRQRLSAAESRRARMQEVESDLTRIEQKVALLYDQAVQQNSLNNAGFRINLPAEALHLQSLSPSAGGGMEEVDSLMTAQLSAH